MIDPDALICGAGFGGLNRSSDPTIGSTVNVLATLGGFITLRNPVGLAIHHLDLAGFQTPGNEPVDESFFTVLRGSRADGLIERAVFEVPAGEGYTVSDVKIGGTPITRGGQIAEHIVVNIVGRAVGLGSFHNTPVQVATSACQNDIQGNWLTYRQSSQSCGPIGRAAFAYPPATPTGSTTPPVHRVSTGLLIAPTGERTPIHRRLTRSA